MATKGKGKKLKKLAQAVQQAQEQQEQAQVVVQPQAAVMGLRTCMMIVGGTQKAPVKADLSAIPAVQPDELTRYGADAKRVQQGLAANILAGTPLSREVLSKTAPCWGERSVRSDKSAFFGLMDLTVSGKMTLPQLREAWNLTLAERKRYDHPTVRALYTAAKQYLLLNGAVEPRISPMARFARSILELINNRTMTSDERLAAIRTKMEEKAEWPEAQSAQKAAGAQ